MAEPDFSDLDAVASALAEACPNAGAIAPLTLMGTGYNSTAVETAGGVIFRLGLNAGVVARHDMEMRLLPVLKGHLPLPIPEPRWRVTPSACFPHGAIGYRKLPGQRLLSGVLAAASDRQRIVNELAGFLLAIHRFPLEEAVACGVPGRDARWLIERTTRDQVMPTLRERLNSNDYDHLADWWKGFLADERLHAFSPVVIHQDASDENILVDDRVSRITAILDFEHCAVDDPALDFMQVHWTGEGFMHEVMQAYGSHGGEMDSDITYRIQRLWEISPFFAIDLAIGRNDEAMLQAYIARLRLRGVLPVALPPALE